MKRSKRPPFDSVEITVHPGGNSAFMQAVAQQLRRDGTPVTISDPNVDLICTGKAVSDPAHKWLRAEARAAKPYPILVQTCLGCHAEKVAE